MNQSSDQRRQYIRFHPGDLEVAIIYFSDSIQGKEKEYDDDTYFADGDLLGLISNQSYKGCNLVVLNKQKKDDFLPEGYECIVKVGVLSPMKAVVRWRNTLTEDVMQIGFEFIES